MALAKVNVQSSGSKKIEGGSSSSKTAPVITWEDGTNMATVATVEDEIANGAFKAFIRYFHATGFDKTTYGTPFATKIPDDNLYFTNAAGAANGGIENKKHKTCNCYFVIAGNDPTYGDYEIYIPETETTAATTVIFTVTRE